MGIVQNLQVMLFVFNLALSTVAQKAVTCQNFKFAIDDDAIHMWKQGFAFTNERTDGDNS